MRLFLQIRRQHCGFVLLDLLWIVVLLGLVVVLSLRGIGLVEKRENADRLKRELVAITAAVEKLAGEKELEPGAEVPFVEYSRFLEARWPKRLREEGMDPLGRPYGEQVVGDQAVPAAESVEELGDLWK